MNGLEAVFENKGAYPTAIRVRLRTVVLVMVVGVGVFGLMSRAGRFLVIDTAGPADLILVLGGDDGNRFEAGLRLLKRGVGPQMLVDADNAERWLGLTEADRLRSLLSVNPEIAGRVKVCPVSAESTLDETRDVAHCIRTLRVTKILIVTSAFTARQSLTTFRRALPQYQWSVSSVDNPDVFGVAWWRRPAWAITTLCEWEKLAWWELVERWTV